MRRRLSALWLALVLAVAACGGDDGGELRAETISTVAATSTRTATNVAVTALEFAIHPPPISAATVVNMTVRLLQHYTGHAERVADLMRSA